jgi:inner membrane protein
VAESKAEEGSSTERSITTKLLEVSLVMGVLLVATYAVTNLVTEREGRRTEAIEGIHATWSGRQSVMGPVVHLAGTPGELHLLPQKLNIKGDVATETRYRGIYQTNVYTTTLVLEGTFAPPDRERLKLPPGEGGWKTASLTLALSDLRGVKDARLVLADGVERLLEPKATPPGLTGQGLGIDIPADALQMNRAGGDGRFRVHLALRGSQGLAFLPAGKVTTASLRSGWPSPSFVGDFLPEKRRVARDGFEAEWRILGLNTGMPDVWRAGAVVALKPAFGVDLPILVDSYRNTQRATKYAVLFILAIFATFLFVELVQGLRIHAIQYVLVGAAVALFYLLLLSVSEHAPFWVAYVAASAIVIAMIAGYTHAALGRRGVTSTLVAVQTALHGYLYTLLQAEDYSLLLGTAGLVVALTGVMYVTRKIDWYKVEHAHARA